MNYRTYAAMMQRINQRKQNLELQNVHEILESEWGEDEFEAQRVTGDWICGRRSLTVLERFYLMRNVFHSM